MEAVLRKLKLKKGEPHESEARKRIQQDLFAFDKCLEQGFPYKSSALAYDPKLSLLAIGTKSGALRIYGRPGVLFSGQLKDDVGIVRITFLPDQGRLVVVGADSSLHLWEINNAEEGYSSIEDVASSFVLDGSKHKSLASCCLSKNTDRLYVGTDEGNLHVLDVPSFKLVGLIISQDVLTQTVQPEYRHNPGAIECIAQHPTSADQILIGFDRGIIVLWDVTTHRPVHTYVSLQQLESLSFNRDGREFVSCHSDGSYIIWTTNEQNFPKEAATTPYGPFPCKAITRLDWKTTSHGNEPFLIFAGGMTRASYGDRFTVTVMQADDHVVFDFTSRVVDFVTLCNTDSLSDANAIDEPHSLIILTEEELVAIDLETPGWPTFNLPYVNSLHTSAVTCFAHHTNLPETLWNKLLDVGRVQTTHYSSREWPIRGGRMVIQNLNARDVLLTGHEDGSVRFWDTSYHCLRLVYKLTTAMLFGVDIASHSDSALLDAGEEWPPFRKVGLYDPFTEDPRLAIQRICLCSLSETLILAGSAGQVIVLQFEREERDSNVQTSTVNIASDNDSFVWRGHAALEVRGCGGAKLMPGFQPACVVQLQPPAMCTAAALHSEWQLFAVGTAYGFALFDYAQRKTVFTHCTLTLTAPPGGGERATLSRRKSLQRSLRDSFRRLRRRRSEPSTRSKVIERKTTTESATDVIPGADRNNESSPAAPGSEAGTSARNTPSRTTASDLQTPVASTSAVSTAMSLRTTDSLADNTVSTIGCVYFADTFLINGQSHCPTLWAATNAGNVFIHQLTIPPSDRREGDIVQCILAKEIRLRHGAPVVSVEVLDRSGRPLPAPLEVQHERAKAPDMTGGHHVLVCSREQLKIFSLPSLKPANKYKLCNGATTHDQLRLRAAAFAGFRGRTEETYVENDLLCLLNTGEVCIFNVPGLRRQARYGVINRDNVVGMYLRVFTQNGKGFFLRTPSEVTHFSVSAHATVRPMCGIVLRDGARPQPRVNEENTEINPAAAARSAAANPSQARNVEDAVDGRLNDSAASTNNDSSLVVGAGDITTDSVQVHVSESSSPSTTTQVICASAIVVTTANVDKLLPSTTDAKATGMKVSTETSWSSAEGTPLKAVSGATTVAREVPQSY